MPNDFIAKLEQLGDVEVRRKLAAGEFGSTGNHYQMVADWLSAQAHSRNVAASDAQILLARSAKKATWIAAIAAIIAAIGAIIAIVPASWWAKIS